MLCGLVHYDVTYDSAGGTAAQRAADTIEGRIEFHTCSKVYQTPRSMSEFTKKFVQVAFDFN